MLFILVKIIDLVIEGSLELAEYELNKWDVLATETKFDDRVKEILLYAVRLMIHEKSNLLSNVNGATESVENPAI